MIIKNDMKTETIWHAVAALRLAEKVTPPPPPIEGG